MDILWRRRRTFCEEEEALIPESVTLEYIDRHSFWFRSTLLKGKVNGAKVGGMEDEDGMVTRSWNCCCFWICCMALLLIIVWGFQSIYKIYGQSNLRCKCRRLSCRPLFCLSVSREEWQCVISSNSSSFAENLLSGLVWWDARTATVHGTGINWIRGWQWIKYSYWMGVGRRRRRRRRRRNFRVTERSSSSGSFSFLLLLLHGVTMVGDAC